MMFYKAEGLLAEEQTDNESQRVQRENTRKIMMNSVRFNEKYGYKGYCFAACSGGGLMTVGMMMHRGERAEAYLQDFLNSIHCPMEDISVAETTINGIQQLLSKADRYGYVEDDDEILERYGISQVTGRRGRGIEFGENVIDNFGRRQLFAQVEGGLLKETMIPELERIYAVPASAKMQGHPVHYILQTDDADTRREAYRLLLQALYANGRLHSKRYCYLNFRPGEGFSSMAFDSLYRICAGGTVVIRYLANDDSEEEATASSERDTIEKICEVVKQHRNQVLTVICLNRECKNTKALFYENLGPMTFVELQEDFAVGQKALDFLKRLAREHHVRTDKNLLGKVDMEKGYLVAELQTLFDEWYNSKLKSTIFPQYKELTTVRGETVKAAPKGSAYDELQEMVGLTEAKGVMRKALNYYKMQKLYEQKGIKKDSPAMHMVFSGNPGTAKTTAARLFARIMKDNGLLSRGQLVEVGRGDLVGKYVGWTAQIVQSKFKAAKGGVLFIDEAYSLVDDCSGSYGDEAINTIVQEMENHRQDVVVIFAGYPKEMERFLQKNPGLRSRIAFHVPFADYNAEELCKIAELMGKSKGICFEDGAMAKLERVFDTACRQSDFGNGRYVRNVLEQAKMNQANRLLEGDFEKITDEEIKTIKAEDIVIPKCKTEEKRTIGFAV